MTRQERILEILRENYRDRVCGLRFSTPFELLVSTILSAQCTDVRVNQVTEKLYAVHNTPEAFAAMTQEELEEWIHSCGFYHNKARNIILTSRILLEKYGGEVPSGMEELTALPGVGRKTANVVRSNAMGIPAIAVDTHVQRVSNRLGLAHSDDVLKTERQLMEAIPREDWSDAHHWLIWHGREICSSQRPKCAMCPLQELCAYRGGAADPGRAV